MANLQNLLRSQELQKKKTTGINAPTSSNPVIKNPRPLNFAQPEKAQTAITSAARGGAFDIKPVNTVSGQDTGLTQGLDDRSKTQIYGTGNTVTPTRATGIAVSEYAPTDEYGSEQSRRFFNELRDLGISQDELRSVTGTDDIQRARAMIEGRADLTPEEQYQLNQAYEQIKFDKAKAEEEARLKTKEEQIRKDLEAQFAPQYTAARQEGERSRETALRIQGRAAMGTKSEQQQQDLSEYQRQVEASIAAEQRLQEQILLAQARGASDETLASLEEGLNAAKAQRQAYQEQQELVQAGLDAQAMELATEKEKQLIKDSLDAAKNGLVWDEETGTYVKDPNFTTPEDYDFELITDDNGNVTQIRTNKSTGEVFSTTLGQLGKASATKYQTQFNPVTGEQIIFDPVSGKNISGGYETSSSSGGSYQTAPTGGFRTDRHNNPTAFTTQIAEQAGLQEGVDYIVGDPFPDNPNMFTAKLIGDPIDETIKVIDKIGFYTQGGQQRWTHTAIPEQQWKNMDYQQKTDVIKDMYKKEGGSGVLFGESAVNEDYVRKLAVSQGKDPKEVAQAVYNWQQTGELPRGKQLTGSDTTKLSDGKVAIDMMISITDIVNSGGTDPIRGATTLVPLLGKYDVEVQNNQAALKRAAQMVGRFMEGGVLRREDEIKYEKMLPNITDKKEVAQGKMIGVLNMLIAKYKTDIDSFKNSGFDTTEFEKSLQQLQQVQAEVQSQMTSAKTADDILAELGIN